jgi:hypothetical protein
VAGKTWVPGSADRDWPSYRKPRAVAAKLVEKGAARVAGPHQQNHYLPIVYDAEAAAKPDWIWQPNTIIDGASGETAPVELVRQTQSAATLRLFIELYHAHALARDGGVDRRGIWQTFTRQTVGQRGPFIVYGFQQGKCWANGDAPFVRPFMTGERETIAGCDRTSDRGWPVFWGAWNRLVRLGLTEIVWHLVEANNDTAEIIHPYAIGNGEAPEQRLADAAHAAGEAMLTDGQRASAEASGLRLAPVLAHITEVQMVGIARLRYRPRTGATAAWFARMAEWDELAARYDEMATEARRDG